MITTIAAVAIVVGALLLTFWVRERDLPEPEPVPPDQHLQERKARIYENLRDLQFEYRLGKLSDADYQRTKQQLQAELAQVLAEIDAMAGKPAAAPKAAKPQKIEHVCGKCKAKFDKPMKFCGDCGEAMG